MTNDKYKQVLPSFQHYESIQFGTNTIGTVYLINISGYHPIIIGKAEIPQIWLYANMNGVVIPLVEQNKAMTPQIKITIDDKSKYLKISIYDFTNRIWSNVIELSYSNKIPYIPLMDLRPLGVNFHSDQENIYFGNNTFSNMNIIGASTFIGSR